MSVIFYRSGYLSDRQLLSKPNKAFLKQLSRVFYSQPAIWPAGMVALPDSKQGVASPREQLTKSVLLNVKGYPYIGNFR